MDVTTPVDAKNKEEQIRSPLEVANATNIVLNSNRKVLPPPYKQYSRKKSLTPQADMRTVNNLPENGGVRLFKDDDWN